MENKSLNIFNSRLILATPTTATDADYAAIEVGCASCLMRRSTSSPHGTPSCVALFECTL
jgi:hypothetical protein